MDKDEPELTRHLYTLRNAVIGNAEQEAAYDYVVTFIGARLLPPPSESEDTKCNLWGVEIRGE